MVVRSGSDQLRLRLGLASDGPLSWPLGLGVAKDGAQRGTKAPLQSMSTRMELEDKG
jgi:hypothetical protein